MRYAKIILPVFCGLCFFSCDKENSTPEEEPEVVNTELKNGLPADLGKVNGFLYVSRNVGGSSSSYYSATGYAMFRDPGVDPFKNWSHFTETHNSSSFGMGVVQVGETYVGNLQLMNSGVFYRANDYGNATLQPFWRTQGNKSFVPLNVQLTRAYPEVVLSNTVTPTISRTNGWQMNMNELATGFDSVLVWIEGAGPPLVKGYSRNASTAGFSADELSLDYVSNCYLNVLAFHYSNITLNNKVYLFEVATRKSFNCYVVN